MLVSRIVVIASAFFRSSSISSSLGKSGFHKGRRQKNKWLFWVVHTTNGSWGVGGRPQHFLKNLPLFLFDPKAFKTCKNKIKLQLCGCSNNFRAFQLSFYFTFLLALSFVVSNWTFFVYSFFPFTYIHSVPSSLVPLFFILSFCTYAWFVIISNFFL